MVEYALLKRLTEDITTRPWWPGPIVLVLPIARSGYWASGNGRVVRYAPLAPLCAVPHELAHVLARADHGREFDRRLAWLLERL